MPTEGANVAYHMRIFSPEDRKVLYDSSSQGDSQPLTAICGSGKFIEVS